MSSPMNLPAKQLPIFEARCFLQAVPRNSQNPEQFDYWVEGLGFRALCYFPRIREPLDGSFPE